MWVWMKGPSVSFWVANHHSTSIAVTAVSSFAVIEILNRYFSFHFFYYMRAFFFPTVEGFI